MKYKVWGYRGISATGASCETLEGAISLAKAFLIDGCTRITIEVQA